MAKQHRILAIALGVSVTFSVAGIRPVMAQTSDELQNRIDQVHKQQTEKQHKVQANKGELSKLESKKAQAIKEANKLEKQIADTENKIDDKQADVNQTKNKISKLKKEIEKTEKRIERRDKLLKKRVRTMYENGSNVQYLEVLLGSQNFSDFLDRVMALNLIAKQDKKLLEEQKADKQKLEKDKKTVENELAKLQDQLQSLKDLKASLAEKKQRKNALVNQLKMKANDIQKDIDEQQQAMKLIQSKISGLIEKREAARKAEEEAARKREKARKQREQQAHHSPSQSSPSVTHYSAESAPQPSGSGWLNVPLPAGSYVISSGYGYRNLGGKDFHDGIDYAAPTGTPILAAASGTVLYAGAASGFGNWIVIDHNNGYYTVYGHMYNNGIYVSAGQQVSQGQKIGAVGSNGHSTGSHLHFEVDRAGDFSGDNGLNPAQFF